MMKFPTTFVSALLAMAGYGISAENLALNRPVTVSSSDWAPTPAEFAVDGEDDTGWRATTGDEQWISVDLQAACSIAALELVSEATAEAKPFVGKDRMGTTGNELLSSCATDYTVQVSEDKSKWTDMYHTAQGKGGREQIQLPTETVARYVRLQIHKRSSEAPVGINELRILGNCSSKRPDAQGWTTRRSAKQTLKPVLALCEDGTVPITSGWELNCQNWIGVLDGTLLSQPGVDTQKWYDATVPGTVLATLVDQGVFPDPVYGLANLKIPEALCRRTWWYRRAFSVPAQFNRSPGRVHWLEFDGVHHSARVWLNGQEIGTVNAFERGRFDVTKYLKKDGENVIAVGFVPMPFPGSPGEKGADGKAWVNSAKLAANEPTFLCASGWDWMPAIRDRATGILDAVRLRSSGAVLVEDLQVETRLPDPSDVSLAHVSLTVPVRNTSAQEQRTTVKIALAPEKGSPLSISQEVNVPAGETVEAVFTPERFPALAIRNPQLWWPNGYGRPDLHTISVQAAGANGTSDMRSWRIGLRDLRCDYFRTKDVVDFPPAQARQVRIFCRERIGKSAYNFKSLKVMNHSQPVVDLALKRDVTASFGGDKRDPKILCSGNPYNRLTADNSDPQWVAVDLGKVQTIDSVTMTWGDSPAKVYDVQISQDGQSWTDVKSVIRSQQELELPKQMQIRVNGVRIFCRGGNWGYDELLHRGGQARLDTALRMHRDSNFTMIRNWTGAITRPEFYKACDENGILVFNDFWSSGMGGGSPMTVVGRHPLYFAAAKDTVLRYRHHPSIAFWCGSNESFPTVAIDDRLQRIVAKYDPTRPYLGHSALDPICGFGPYSWASARDYAKEYAAPGRTRGFKSEIGMPTVPLADSMRKLAGDQPSWPIGPVWNYHDWCPAGGQRSANYAEAIELRLGQAKDLDDFCRKAQFINYEGMRQIFENFNHKLWKDCSAALIWMSHPAWMSTTWQTYDYDFEVNGSHFGAMKACEPFHIQATLTDWSVDVLNHTPRPLFGAKATVASFDLGGRRLGEVQTQVIDLPSSNVVPLFTAAWPAEAPPLHLLRLELRDSSGKLLSENTYWRYLKAEDMQALNSVAQTALHVEVKSRSNGSRCLITATLTNTGQSVAAMVMLSLRRSEDNSRILPAFHSDGGLWLLPKETRTITIECAREDLRAGTPAVQVSGYNLPTRLIKAL